MGEGMISIDGSIGEGGGQVLRTSVALSVVTGKPVEVYNIRAKRCVPGLRAQHVAAVRAIRDLCGGRVEGLHEGSTRIRFYPGNKKKGSARVEIPTAGSVGLVLQAVMIASVGMQKARLEIEGGATWGKWAPPIDYTIRVLLPILEKMGYSCSIRLEMHGFYPHGGARVFFESKKPRLAPLDLQERGKIERITVYSLATRNLENRKVAERQKEAAMKVLEEKLGGERVESVTEYHEGQGSTFSGVLIVAEAENTVLGETELGERNMKAECVGKKPAERVVRLIESGATVDEHMADQLIPYMALAPPISIYKAPLLTRHAKTNIGIVNRILGTRFETRKMGKTVTVSRI